MSDWIEWAGGKCPIEDNTTVFEYRLRSGTTGTTSRAFSWSWTHSGQNWDIVAYRICKINDRPTPFPESYDDLAFGENGVSQTIIVDGSLPRWLHPDDLYQCGFSGKFFPVKSFGGNMFAVRIKRREPVRITQVLQLCLNGKSYHGTIDLLDGEPVGSSLKLKREG